MDKVKLPREVAEAIEAIRRPHMGFSNYAIIGLLHGKRERMEIEEIRTIDRYLGQDGMHPDDFINALVNGYEVEQTPEEKVRGMFELPGPFNNGIGEMSTAYRDGIRDTLMAFNIKIEGINS